MTPDEMRTNAERANRHEGKLLQQISTRDFGQEAGVTALITVVWEVGAALLDELQGIRVDAQRRGAEAELHHMKGGAV